MLKILQILLHKDYKFMFHQLKKKSNIHLLGN